MKTTALRTHIKAARWAALGNQARAQGLRFDHITKHARAVAEATYPDNAKAAVAYAALRIIIACNSKPTPADRAALDNALSSS